MKRIRLIFPVLIPLLVTAASAGAATLSAPVTFAFWDFEDGDLVMDGGGAPFASIGMATLFGAGSAFGTGDGMGGGNAVGLDSSNVFPDRNYVDFTVTNTHPTEALILEDFSFNARRAAGSGHLSMNYQLEMDFEREIDDAVSIDGNWSSHSFSLSALTGFGIPSLNFDLDPAETITFRVIHREANSPAGASTAFIDNMTLTGRTVVPEPSTSVLAAFACCMLLRRRRS